jgi:hypothetical protein
LLLLLLLINKTLRTLTYKFLIFIFISEILGSIGNICEYSKSKIGSSLLIPFSDIFTMGLFCCFSICSVELIKKSNRKIKEKEIQYILFSFIGAIVYSLIVFFIIYFVENDNGQSKYNRFYFYEDSKLNFLRFIHFGILVCISSFICYKTFEVIEFMKEKQKSDKINSWKIAKLIKVLFRFPLICVLYWFFYLPSLILRKFNKTQDKKITSIFTLFSISFFSLRGFLIFLNTIKTNKVQIIFQSYAVFIRHLILKFDLYSKRKRTIKDKGKEKKDEDDEPY